MVHHPYTHKKKKKKKKIGYSSEMPQLYNSNENLKNTSWAVIILDKMLFSIQKSGL